MLLVSRLASASLRKGTIAQWSADMFKLSDGRHKLESVADFQHSDARGLVEPPFTGCSSDRCRGGGQKIWAKD